MFEPLHITAHLGAPYVGEFTVPLDGILTALALADDAPLYYVPGQRLDYDPVRVPLAVVNPGAQWFFACSFACWGPYVEGNDYWNKRADLEWAELFSTTQKINIKAGATKNYHHLIHYRHACTIAWDCVGDADRIRRLLADCSYIGGKSAHGWGRVLRWDITRMTDDWSVMDESNTPTRAIPIGYFGGAFNVNWVIARRAYRPPYWARDNVSDVFLPVLS